MSLETLTITSAGGRTEAQFVPAANLVCCSLVHDGVERLELRRGLATYAEAGKTMGIPLLYPWANRLARFGYEVAGQQVVLSDTDERLGRDSQGLPIHGVVPGYLGWEVADAAEPSAIEAQLAWTSAELLELFPFRHQVRVNIALADGELTIATTVRATSDDPVPVSFGYHPYLRNPSAARATWEVELAASRRLVLDDRGIPTGEREPVEQTRVTLNETSWDTPFDGLAHPAEWSAEGGGARMTVTFRAGYEFAQVFAPAELEAICFEPMTATTNALNSGDGLRIVPPGGEHRAEFTVAFAGERPDS
jgi:galactose mutarotase-like enzyme